MRDVARELGAPQVACLRSGSQVCGTAAVCVTRSRYIEMTISIGNDGHMDISPVLRSMMPRGAPTSGGWPGGIARQTT